MHVTGVPARCSSRASWAVCAGIVLFVSLTALARPAHAASGVWRPAWGKSMSGPNGSTANRTCRFQVRPAVGGDAIQLRVSNRFGTAPMTVGGLTLAAQTSGAGIGGPVHHARFGGQPAKTIPAGGSVYTDPIPMAVQANDILLASIYVRGSATISHHQGPRESAWCASGDKTASGAAAFASIGAASWWIDTATVRSTFAHGTVVFGDSISDKTRPDALERWTDGLPLLNAAIGGTTLSGNASRLQYDVAARPGVDTLVVFLGTNDLLHDATAKQVLDWYRAYVNWGHLHGYRVVGATIIARNGGIGWSPLKEEQRVAVNAVLRTGVVFDRLLDFDRVVSTGDVLNPAYDPGDHTHPNALGQRAMWKYYSSIVGGTATR